MPVNLWSILLAFIFNFQSIKFQLMTRTFESRPIFSGLGLSSEFTSILLVLSKHYFSTVAWLLPSLISAIFYYKVCSTVWKSRFWGTADDNLKMTTPAPPSAAEDSALTTRAMR
jgi:hypothetical protein